MTRSQQRLRWAVRTGGWSPDSAEWEMLLSLLPSAEERQQCMRYRNLDDRCRTLVGRLLARQAAAAALGLPFAAVDLRRTRGNKPYVANQLPSKAHGPAPNWNFSVSHEVRKGAHQSRNAASWCCAAGACTADCTADVLQHLLSEMG